MAEPVIQSSFASGEFAPALNARVDLAKYHSAAALIRNYFVDYRGGVSTRPGTKYVLQTRSTSRVRLIAFQASPTLSYVLEFGQNYIRFYSQGEPILEAAKTITAITQANPGVVTSAAHGYASGDWLFLEIAGMTQLNGNYYIVANSTTNTYTLTDLNGNAINTTAFGAFVSGTSQRVYTITSPYLSTDVENLKFVQNVTSLIICNPLYPPYVLTLNTAANWTLSAITFGPTINPPTSVGSDSSLGSGIWNYGYVVTAVDINGQESAASGPTFILDTISIQSTPGSHEINWAGPPAAVSYNVYETTPTVNNFNIPADALYGFVGNTTASSFINSYPSIAPDFSQTPPIVSGPSLGGNVTALNLTGNANYTSVPAVTIAPPSSGYQATGFISLAVTFVGVSSGGEISGHFGDNPTGEQLTLPNGVVLNIASATLLGDGGWRVTAVTIANGGSITGGSVPGNPVTATGVSGGWTVTTEPSFNLTWQIGNLLLSQGGFGYTSAPAVTIPGGATATATISTSAATKTFTNPSVPGFYQERLVLGAPNSALSSFFMSQPGSFYNFNYSNPSEADDAIFGTIISTQLNTIQWFVTVPTGIIAGTDKAAWLINGSGGAVPITPSDATANSQAFNGANYLPPIQINFDILYGQAKGSYIRDLTYNFYANIFTGTDISVLSSHLFYGYSITEWAWAEEPFKTVWAVRSDGIALSLGFLKEQEIVGWAHSDTNGQFMSVCSVTELISVGFAAESVPSILTDAVYWVVQRQVNGNTIQYIERMADRIFPYGEEDAWCVDAGLESAPTLTGTGTLTISAASGAGVTFTSTASDFTSAVNGQVIRAGGGIATITNVVSATQVTATITQSISYVNEYSNLPFPASPGNWTLWTPFTTFTGLNHLIGMSVVGLADGAVVGPLTVSAAGTVTLPNPATKVILGLAFLPQLQTLQLDLGQPTVQGEYKKITGVTVRCQDTLGLQIGSSFANSVNMKDLVIGNVGTMTNQVVSGLVTGDARTIIDPLWQVPGQYCIQQPNPYPATVLGVIPEITSHRTK